MAMILHARAGIGRDGRLVGKNDVRPVYQGAGDRDSLLPAAG
jgi:hypothetical protein